MVISETTIISKQIIKPSSPTPNRLRKFKLSYLDEHMPPLYIPLIFFYENDGSSKLKQQKQEEISQSLRQSLSRILSVFYPLAGRIEGNSSIECNDRGAEFTEARVHGRLSQFMGEPKAEELQQLIPVDGSYHSFDDVLVSVKISFFDCGGIAVGICLSHKIGDIESFVQFMNAWAATAHGGTRVVEPSFELTSRFRARGLDSSRFTGYEEKIVRKRFVFQGEHLERLRQQVAASGELKDPTSEEAVLAFIWKHSIEANRAESDAKITSFAASHSVDWRPRAIPPIPDYGFGNCHISSIAVVTPEKTDIGHLASKLRAAVRAVDNNYIDKVLADEEFKPIQELAELHKQGSKSMAFGSWMFPVYDVDFGWGKPVWVSPPELPYNNRAVLMSTPAGDGIEAWINLPTEDFFRVLETNYSKLLN